MSARDGIRKVNGKWRVRWMNAKGGRQEATLEVSTRAEAKEKRAQLISKTRDQRLGIWDGDSSATFNDIWKLQYKTAKVKANWRTVEGYWRNHLKPAFGDVRLRQLSRNDLRTFLVEKQEEGLSPRTCEHLRMRLVVLYNFAAGEGIYRGENVASAIGGVEVVDREPQSLPFELVQAVIDAVPEGWRNFFAMAVYTGMRSGELRALTRSSASPDWKAIRVSRSGSRATTKTGKGRWAPMPKAVLPYFRDAMEKAEGKDWLFMDGDGKQLSRHIKPPMILRLALERLGAVEKWTGWCPRKCKARQTLKARPDGGWRCPKCKRLGKVQPEHPMVFHDLRKTWETHMEEVAQDPMAVFRMAGHTSAVALQHYLNRNPRRLAELADRLDFRNPAPFQPRAALESGGDVVESVGTELKPSEGSGT